MKRLLILIALFGVSVSTAMGTVSLLASAKDGLSRLEARGINLVIEKTGIRISDVVSLPQFDFIDPNQQVGHVPDFGFSGEMLDTSKTSLVVADL